MRVVYRFHVYTPNVVVRSLGFADLADDADFDVPLVEEFV